MKKLGKVLSLSGAALLFMGMTAPAFAAAPTINEYPTATGSASPIDLTYAAGNIWYTQHTSGADSVGIMDTTGAPVTTVALPSGAQPNGMAYDQTDGEVYVAEYGLGEIAGIGYTSHAVTQYPILSSGAHKDSTDCIGNASATQPVGVAIGPNGDIWFTEAGSNCVGVMDISGTMKAEYPITTSGNTRTDKITEGANGYMYFTESSGDHIFAINGLTEPSNATPATGYAITSSTHIEGLVYDNNSQDLYFADNDANKIGIFSTANNTMVKYVAATTSSAGLDDLAFAGDGNIWFTESTGNQIGSMTPDGTMGAEYAVTSGPTGIISAPYGGSGDNGVWFTETAASKIGVLDITSITGSGNGSGNGSGAGGSGTAGTTPSATTPKAPDTGLAAAILGNPVGVLVTTATAAGAMYMISRRLKPVTANRK